MIPTPRGPDVPPPPPPLPGPGAPEPSPAVLAYKAWEDLEELKREMRGLTARFEGLERRVAALEEPRAQ